MKPYTEAVDRMVHSPRPVLLRTVGEDAPASWSEAATTHGWPFNRRAMSASSGGETDSNMTVISSKSCFLLW
jgi:hypothetical protein